ncbi:hypothetical protein MTLP_02260 [Candidatus Methanoliparum sp. LAM-1]|nr:hypothetical protein MTLP_02260 [Candidatus Methanoliparum sp. LAM-1]
MELTKKLLSQWWPKLGYRERVSVIQGIRSVKPDPCNPGIYIINNHFQVAYKNPRYPDRTVLE